MVKALIVPDIIIYSYRQGGAPVNLGVPSFFIWCTTDLGSVLNWKLIRLENWRRASRMKRYGLRDDPWERIKGLLPGRAGHVGVTARNNRRFVEAVLYRYRAGIAWRDLAQWLGHCKAVHTRFSRWAKRGVWERFFKALASEARIYNDRQHPCACSSA